MAQGICADLESYPVSPAEAQQLHPLMNVSDLCGAIHTPGDGHIDPTALVRNVRRCQGGVRNPKLVFTSTSLLQSNDSVHPPPPPPPPVDHFECRRSMHTQQWRSNMVQKCMRAFGLHRLSNRTAL